MLWSLLRMPISDATRQLVRERANYLCEYCHSLERLSANRFTIDHITPRSLGGSDDLENLALACRCCNERRYNFVASVDPETQVIVPLFNPRQQSGKTILRGQKVELSFKERLRLVEQLAFVLISMMSAIPKKIRFGELDIFGFAQSSIRHRMIH